MQQDAGTQPARPQLGHQPAVAAHPVMAASALPRVAVVPEDARDGGVASQQRVRLGGRLGDERDRTVRACRSDGAQMRQVPDQIAQAWPGLEHADGGLEVQWEVSR